MEHTPLEGNKETSETEKEKLRQEYFPEDYFKPKGLVDIYKLYKQRKDPPIGSDDDVYYPYREKEDDGV